MPKPTKTSSKQPTFLQRNLGWLTLVLAAPFLVDYALGLGQLDSARFVWLSYPIKVDGKNGIETSSDGKPVQIGQTLYMPGNSLQPLPPPPGPHSFGVVGKRGKFCSNVNN